MKFSIVIRVKNEVEPLRLVLGVLRTQYQDDIDEIIIVNNNSTDGTLELAREHQCVITTISNFTYGKAINQGIAAASGNHIILLSAHSLPIGASFFTTLKQRLQEPEGIAAGRFINSAQNYKRAITSDFKVTDPIQFGLTASCAYVYKPVWEQEPFDEHIIACEDKLWSKKVLDLGYQIIEIPETFFYFATRTEEAALRRERNETLASKIITKSQPIGMVKAILVWFKSITIGSFRALLKHWKVSWMRFKNNLFMHSYFQKNTK